jgi:hypothetical protein
LHHTAHFLPVEKLKPAEKLKLNDALRFGSLAHRFLARVARSTVLLAATCVVEHEGDGECTEEESLLCPELSSDSSPAFDERSGDGLGEFSREWLGEWMVSNRWFGNNNEPRPAEKLKPEGLSIAGSLALLVTRMLV